MPRRRLEGPRQQTTKNAASWQWSFINALPHMPQKWDIQLIFIICYGILGMSKIWRNGHTLAPLETAPSPLRWWYLAALSLSLLGIWPFRLYRLQRAVLLSFRHAGAIIFSFPTNLSRRDTLHWHYYEIDITFPSVVTNKILRGDMLHDIYFDACHWRRTHTLRPAVVKDTR